ncbi:hypothetical protein QQS21_000772 [Conoideocrella luteorostrata]|uniref:Uncharacterized protein n=1 Tax=Conoideocrella luteorostrata TaxID=1105319 RepID=A0AAJ0CYJ7_9HYPO|nr:hypothetical protein QQS21_000772 [Conoideocrella luteorostrata]
MQPNSIFGSVAVAVAFFLSTGAFAAPTEDIPRAPQIGGYCVPDGGHGNCVIADHGKIKTIKCAADKPCPKPKPGANPKRGHCDWRGGYAECRG